MILRRYGSTYQSVEVDFDPRAITEIQFRRDRKVSIPQEEFERDYERDDVREISLQTDGPVQSEAEQELMDRLEAEVRAFEEAAGPDRVVVVENQPGVDWPKIHDRKESRVVGGENRLHFHWRMDPPLRLAVYRKKAGDR